MSTPVPAVATQTSQSSSLDHLAQDFTSEITHLLHPQNVGDFVGNLLSLAQTATGAISTFTSSGTHLAAAADLFGNAIGELGRGQITAGANDVTRALGQGLGEVRQLGLFLGHLLGEDWQ